LNKLSNSLGLRSKALACFAEKSVSFMSVAISGSWNVSLFSLCNDD
jgi:hypothetical protein